MTDVASTEDVRRLEEKVSTAMGRLDTELAAIAQHHGDAKWQKYQEDLTGLRSDLLAQIEALRSSLPSADAVAQKSELAEIRATLSELQESLKDPPEEAEGDPDPTPPPVQVVDVLPETPPPEPKKGYDWI